MSVIDELVENAESYAESFDKSEHGRSPEPVRIARAERGRRARDPERRRCHHGRRDPLALHLPEAPRNGGDHADPAQRLRMLTFADDEFRHQVQEDTGIKPEWAAEAFEDLDEDVRQSIARIKASAFIPRKDKVRGFVYEVETGRLREVA
jgi:hypothetical protein